MKTLFPFLGLLFLLGACVKNNPDPAWIEVTEWQLVANPGEQYPTGELTESFTDAWLYIDDELIGVFEVPFKVPVLKSGTSNIKIYPAVLNNGISATKKIYPFVEFYETNVELVQNQTVTINPTTQYYAFTQFWIEDFENAGFQIDDDPTSPVQIQTSDDPTIIQSFNGNKFGRITLDATNNRWIGYTDATLNLPAGQEVFLEIDYHNTNRLVTGVLAISSVNGVIDNPNIQLNPQNDSEVVWKKIYIDLREIVSNSPNTDHFEISFQALIDDGEAAGEINIDNIKIVRF